MPSENNALLQMLQSKRWDSNCLDNTYFHSIEPPLLRLPVFERNVCRYTIRRHARTEQVLSANQGSSSTAYCSHEIERPHTTFQLYSTRLYEIRRPLRNRIHQTRQIPPHLQRKHARVHHPQIPRPEHYHLLAHDPSCLPRSHRTGTDGMILAAETIPHERLHVTFVELVETWLKSVAAVFEVG